MSLKLREARAEFVEPEATRVTRLGQYMLAIAVWMLDKEYGLTDPTDPTADVVENPWDIDLSDDEIDRKHAELEDAQPTIE